MLDNQLLLVFLNLHPMHRNSIFTSRCKYEFLCLTYPVITIAQQLIMNNMHWTGKVLFKIKF